MDFVPENTHMHSSSSRVWRKSSELSTFLFIKLFRLTGWTVLRLVAQEDSTSVKLSSEEPALKYVAVNVVSSKPCDSELEFTVLGLEWLCVLIFWVVRNCDLICSECSICYLPKGQPIAQAVGFFRSTLNFQEFFASRPFLMEVLTQMKIIYRNTSRNDISLSDSDLPLNDFKI